MGEANGMPPRPLMLAVHESCRDSPRITWLSDMGVKGRAMLLDLYLRWHRNKSAQGEVMLALVEYECELAQQKGGWPQASGSAAAKAARGLLAGTARVRPGPGERDRTGRA